MDKATTIVHVTAYYPPRIGGMERMAKETAEHLARRGYDVRVITSNTDMPKHILQKEHLNIKALSSFEFAHTPFAPTLIWHLLRIPKKSIMHLHLSQAYYPEIVLLVSKLRNIPYVTHFHLDVRPSGKLGWLFVIYKKIAWGPVLRNASKVIAFTPEQADIVATKFGVKKENIVVIPNAVDEDFFLKRPYIPARDELRLLYVGRLTPQKRAERLVQAMALVGDGVRLSIVGDGEDRPDLEQQAVEAGLQESKVAFKGRKYGTELLAEYDNADAFVISSDLEGMPLVVLEAMAAALPIIASNVPGIRELVEGTGVLISEPYAENFAKTFTELRRSPERLTALAAKSFAKAKEYTWNNLIERLIAAYSEVLS